MATAEESTAQSQYDQKAKKKCREELIEHAVRALTTERDTSVCVHQNFVRTAWRRLRETSETSHFTEEEVGEIEKDIDEWERLHDSNLPTKKPSDLHVCYLAGDDPLNDFHVFRNNGVLPQNMWAIEKDHKTFKKALDNMNQSQEKPKVFKGNFLDFLRDVKGQFDIIYFDACGSLPSAKQETLKAIGYVFLYDKLTSPGALITTFSFPPAASNATPQDTERTKLNEFTREYLKCRLVNTSFAHKIPHFNEKGLESRSDEENYSEYIVHQIIDTAYMYIPAHRMISSKRNSLLEQSFVKKGDIKKAIEQLLPDLKLKGKESPSQLLLEEVKEIESEILEIGDQIQSMQEQESDFEDDLLDYSPKLISELTDRTMLTCKEELRHFLDQIRKLLQSVKSELDQLKNQKESKKQEKERKMLELSDHEAQPSRILGQLGHNLKNLDNSLCKRWCSEVFPDWKSDDLKDWEISLLLMVHLLTNWIVFIDKCSNQGFKDCLESIKSLGGDGDESIFSQFADVPNDEITTQMIATLLYGQMAHPSFPVLEKLKRLRYTAKTRQMFSNVFIFDRCRYVYDQFASVHTSASAVAKPHRQMVFRMAVDGLRKHIRHICEEDVFKCCNVVEQELYERVAVIPPEITLESSDDDLLHADQ